MSITNNAGGITVAMLKKLLADMPEKDIHGTDIVVCIRTEDYHLPAISVEVEETLRVDPEGNFCKQLTLSQNYM